MLITRPMGYRWPDDLQGPGPGMNDIEMEKTYHHVANQKSENPTQTAIDRLFIPGLDRNGGLLFD
ncbi:hypothetical protein DESC_740065 [Desulfosarcina cetonica]|nr:hypothetical protein DESC_740065 [Desulfosarcina cetonica]